MPDLNSSTIVLSGRTALVTRTAVLAAIALIWSPMAGALLLVVVSPPARAAVAAIELPQLSLWLLLGLWLLSSLSGVTALLWRINRILTESPGQPLPRPWLFCGSHMAGSWMAAVFAFALAHFGSEGAPSIWTVVIGVLLGSFAGAKLLESAAEWWFARGGPMGPRAD